MKTTYALKRKYLPYIFSFLVVLNCSQAFAQADPLLEDTESVLNSEQIDIDGTFKKKTAADRIEEMRKKLEKQNEEMVDKKIESMRIAEEQKLTRKLQKAFAGQMQALDETPVVVKQAAPKVVKEVPKKEEKKSEGIKILPTFSLTSMQSNEVDYETKVDAGLSIEAMLSKRFSAGLEFNYATMNIGEGNNYNTYNNYYGQGYVNHYGGQYREVEYKKLAFGLNGKFFLTTETRIKPYIGAGVFYNRVSLNYSDENGTYYNPNYNVYYGDEGYSSSYVSGQAIVGAEVAFTDMFGMVLEFNYTKGLSSGFSSKSKAQSGYLNPDQVKLEEHAEKIENADFFTIGGGIVVSF